MSKTTTTGSVKVGRWEYPAELATGKDGFPHVKRWTKRDGTGELVPVTEQKVIDSFAPAETDEEPQALTGVVAPVETSADYRALREVHERIFNSGIWANKDDLQFEFEGSVITEKRGHELARYLARKDLVVREISTKSDGFSTGEPIYSSTPNWDEVSLEQSLALFDAAVPTDVVVAAHKIRADKPVNNTHAKPGKSSWLAGDTCPRGTHVLNGANVYVMPSGRKQCKDCRAGYPSNL